MSDEKADLSQGALLRSRAPNTFHTSLFLSRSLSLSVGEREVACLTAHTYFDGCQCQRFQSMDDMRASRSSEKSSGGFIIS